MNKLIYISLALYILDILSSCSPEPQWKASLYLKNCIADSIYIETNISTCDSTYPYSNAGNKFILAPGELVVIAQSKHHYNESNPIITIEQLVDNYEGAYVTISVKLSDKQVSKTWEYSNRNNGSKQLFNLNDSKLESSKDGHKAFETYQYYFMITENLLVE